MTIGRSMWVSCDGDEGAYSTADSTVAHQEAGRTITHLRGASDGCPYCSTTERSDDEGLPLHRTEAGYPRCSTCDGGGCPDCTDPA